MCLYDALKTRGDVELVIVALVRCVRRAPVRVRRFVPVPFDCVDLERYHLDGRSLSSTHLYCAHIIYLYLYLYVLLLFFLPFTTQL